MEALKVIINGIETELYIDVAIHGNLISVASPILEREMNKIIENDGYYTDDVWVNGTKMKANKLDGMYFYVYGDEDNLHPTEEEIIESIDDVYQVI